jgi:hypothetical protein
MKAAFTSKVSTLNDVLFLFLLYFLLDNFTLFKPLQGTVTIRVFSIILLYPNQVLVDVVGLVLHSVEPLFDVLTALTSFYIIFGPFLRHLGCFLGFGLFHKAVEIVFNLVVVTALTFVSFAKLVDLTEGSCLFVLLGVQT